MPFCDPINIPFVATELQRLQPSSIVDIGIGMGGWGVVVREYLEFWYGRTSRTDWKVRLEGIEIFENYRNPLWELYDRVEIGDALPTLPKLGKFDVGICCDVIEHLSKSDGRRLLDLMLDCCDTVILTTPVTFQHQDGPLQGENLHQQHLSLWSERDFVGTTGKLVTLGGTFGACVSKSPGAQGPKMQQRFDHIGVRLLLKALGRRLYLKATSQV